MTEKNILDYEEQIIPETYHADKSIKYLLRGFLLLIISGISICASIYVAIEFREFFNKPKSISLAFLSIISFGIAAIFAILGLYHLVECFQKKEILTDRRRIWLLLLGVSSALLLVSFIIGLITG